MQVSLLQNTGLQCGEQQSAVMHVGTTNSAELCLCSLLLFNFSHCLVSSLYFNINQSQMEKLIISDNY